MSRALFAALLILLLAPSAEAAVSRVEITRGRAVRGRSRLRGRRRLREGGGSLPRRARSRASDEPGDGGPRPGPAQRARPGGVHRGLLSTEAGRSGARQRKPPLRRQQPRTEAGAGPAQQRARGRRSRHARARGQRLPHAPRVHGGVERVDFRGRRPWPGPAASGAHGPRRQWRARADGVGRHPVQQHGRQRGSLTFAVADRSSAEDLLDFASAAIRADGGAGRPVGIRQRADDPAAAGGDRLRIGTLYQLVYKTGHPPVSGIGFAATRDLGRSSSTSGPMAPGPQTRWPRRPDPPSAGRWPTAPRRVGATCVTSSIKASTRTRGRSHRLRGDDTRHHAAARMFLDQRFAQPERGASGLYPDQSFPFAYRRRPIR